MTQLSPGARLLWRSERTVQLELGSRAVVVDGIGSTGVRRLLGRPNPGGEKPTDPDDGVLDGVADELVTHGFLWPAGSGPDDRRAAPPQPRLAAELGALTVEHGTAAAALLAARGGCTVAVHGNGRAGPLLAALLAAAGVGRVHVLERSVTRLHHAVPGGVLPSDEGVPLSEAAAAAVHRAAPETDTTAPALGERPDLVVLALDNPVEPERREALHARDVAHLLVRTALDHGAVGPLVIPGLTSCLGCTDRHRLDRDPAWSALAVQLATPHRATGSSSVALATMLAGVAALEALAYLDGERPATIEGSLEVHLPDWRLRRRTWPPHPECACMRDSD